MSALMIATIAVKDAAKFQEYLSETQKVAAPYGAELLCRGKADRTLTGGEAGHALTVIVKFPDLQTIDDWYASDAYQALIPLRDQGTDMTMVSYEALD